MLTPEQQAALPHCPFCGRAPRYLPKQEGFYVESVICDTCHVSLPPAVWSRRALSQPAQPDTDKLLAIIASAYQIAGAHDAPEHILDVLADPEAATVEQVEAMLPYQPGWDVPTVLFDGMAVYEEVRRKAGHMRTSPENVSDVLNAVVRLIWAAPAEQDERKE